MHTETRPAGAGVEGNENNFDSTLALCRLGLFLGRQSETERRQEIRGQLETMQMIVKDVSREDIKIAHRTSLGDSETSLTASYQGKTLVLSSRQMSGGQLIAYDAELRESDYSHLSIGGYRYSSDWRKEEIGVFLQKLYTDLRAKQEGKKPESVDPLTHLAASVHFLLDQKSGG